MIKVLVGCVKKYLNIEMKKKIQLFKVYCHLTVKFRGLDHINCNLNTRKAHTSFVPTFHNSFHNSIHNFSGYDFHLIFEKLINMSKERGIKIKEEDIIAK